MSFYLLDLSISLCVVRFMCVNCQLVLMPKCEPYIVYLQKFLSLTISRMYVRLGTLCVTVSLWLLALGIILFPISCIHLELCAHNILLSHLLSVCPVHVFHVFLSLTLSHKKSSLRGSVAQMADGNKQGAEPPGHPYHLVALSLPIVGVSTHWGF